MLDVLRTTYVFGWYGARHRHSSVDDRYGQSTWLQRCISHPAYEQMSCSPPQFPSKATAQVQATLVEDPHHEKVASVIPDELRRAALTIEVSVMAGAGRVGEQQHAFFMSIRLSIQWNNEFWASQALRLNLATSTNSNVVSFVLISASGHNVCSVSDASFSVRYILDALTL